MHDGACKRVWRQLFSLIPRSPHNNMMLWVIGKPPTQSVGIWQPATQQKSVLVLCICPWKCNVAQAEKGFKVLSSEHVCACFGVFTAHGGEGVWQHNPICLSKSNYCRCRHKHQQPNFDAIKKSKWNPFVCIPLWGRISHVHVVGRHFHLTDSNFLQLAVDLDRVVDEEASVDLVLWVEGHAQEAPLIPQPGGGYHLPAQVQEGLL